METITLFQSILVGGVATTLATQILKSPIVTFIKAEKYPRLTALVVSVIAAVATIANQGLSLKSLAVIDVATVVVGTLLVAAATYNHLLRDRS